MGWNTTKSMEGSFLGQLDVTAGELFCRTCGNDDDSSNWGRGSLLL